AKTIFSGFSDIAVFLCGGFGGAEGFVPQVEGEAADLSEQCAECEKKGGDGEGFAADGQQISTQEDEQHKCQCEEGNRQQIDFSAVHGVRSETVCSDYSRLGRYSLELGKMPSETGNVQTAFDFQGFAGGRGAVSGMRRPVRIFPANFPFGRKPYISRLPI
ncbi:hypothetical protein LN384_25155, partial [Enterobacter hormaechei subsp. steigerwaltii]|nr:hypothetical protein [Enterobacter hormaechei subsp. steigerwaltii]